MRLKTGERRQSEVPVIGRGASASTLLLILGVALMAKGFYDWEQASPSPHGYVEVFYALPQVVAGILISIGSLSTKSFRRWVRIAGILIAGLGAIAALALFSLIWWFSVADP